MPYYEKNKPKKLKAEVDVNQTMFDDLIILSGDTGSYIGLIPLAENLPNLTIGGGRRNVISASTKSSDNRFKKGKNEVRRYISS